MRADAILALSQNAAVIAKQKAVEATKILNAKFIANVTFGIFRFILKKLKDPWEASQFCLLSEKITNGTDMEGELYRGALMRVS